AAGCKGGNAPPPLQTCGPNGECPSGYMCNANDNLCYQSGDTPDATPAHPAALSSDQKSHDFGDVVMGGVSVATTVTIANDGDVETGPLQPVVMGAGLAAYVMDGDCSGRVLRKLETCHVNLTF